MIYDFLKKTSKLNQGFTLVELIVVFSVLIILSMVGIAAFMNYSRIEALNTSVLDVVSMLNVAKSRAISQMKPGDCPTLDGYQVAISALNTYTLTAICEGYPTSPAIEEKELPANITFDSTGSFSFDILTGVVKPEGTIIINGYGRTKTITVFSNGKIIVE